eukprot:11217725-Lingulodinium_polyedra.AAC.1
MLQSVGVSWRSGAETTTRSSSSSWKEWDKERANWATRVSSQIGAYDPTGMPVGRVVRTTRRGFSRGRGLFATPAVRNSI